MTEVSYPDPLHPEYSRRLKAATAGSNVVRAHADVPTVSIPADNALKLVVSLCPMPPEAGPSVCQPAGHSQSMACMESKSKSALVSPVIQWLMEAAEMLEGYTAFKQGQHHMQTNADVVASWWFAVLFSECYSRTEAPVQVSDGGHK